MPDWVDHETSLISLDSGFTVDICDRSCKKGPYENCEKYRPVQPAQSAQADQDRKFSLLADFLSMK